MFSDEPSDAELSDADTIDPWDMVTEHDMDLLRARLTVLEQQLNMH